MLISLSERYWRSATGSQQAGVAGINRNRWPGRSGLGGRKSTGLGGRFRPDGARDRIFGQYGSCSGPVDADLKVSSLPRDRRQRGQWVPCTGSVVHMQTFPRGVIDYDIKVPVANAAGNV